LAERSQIRGSGCGMLGCGAGLQMRASVAEHRGWVVVFGGDAALQGVEAGRGFALGGAGTGVFL
jgi:hypothetical protein